MEVMIDAAHDIDWLVATDTDGSLRQPCFREDRRRFR